MRKQSLAWVALATAGLAGITPALAQDTGVQTDRAEPQAIALLRSPVLALPPASTSHITPLRTEILREITVQRARVRDERIVHWLNELGGYYADPDNEPLWIRNGSLTPLAGELMEELGRAGDWGLRPIDYDVPSAYGSLTKKSDQAMAEIDLTLAALTYAHHANGGRFDPTDLSLWYDMKPQRVVADKLLARLSSSRDASAVMRSLHPTHPQFVALREAYLDLIKPERVALRDKPVAAEPRPEDVYLSKGPRIRLGKRHPQIALLRQRLEVPALSRDYETLYDRDVMNAVNRFMRTQGWKRKTIYDNKVRAKLNANRDGRSSKPAKISKRALLVNMEKWRWMPRKLGNFHIWNNIPSYRTEVRNDGEVIHSERIIVGKKATQTPVFNDRMTHIIFKPEWGVPNSIKIKSLLPRLAGGDYDVLRRRGMRIALNGRSGNPRSINWAKRDIRSIPIVQGAGPSNPLGRMKFMFPNKHAVYMHDTPKKGLFNTKTRTHSHGCIRVRNPQRLAEVLTKASLGWSPNDVAAHLGRRAQDSQRVDLSEPIPVYNTYFTLVADETGQLRGYKDMYGHDKRIGQALDGKSLDLIARNDPARIHNAKIKRLAANIPVYRPKNAWDQPSFMNPPTYSLGFFGQQANKPKPKYKKVKYGKNKYRKKRVYHNQAVFSPFWNQD